MVGGEAAVMAAGSELQSDQGAGEAARNGGASAAVRAGLGVASGLFGII